MGARMRAEAGEYALAPEIIEDPVQSGGHDGRLGGVRQRFFGGEAEVAERLRQWW